MIKEALQYVVGLNKAEIVRLNERNYTDKPLHDIDNELLADTVKFTTLQSLVTYIKSEPDVLNGNQILLVESPTRVRMMSTLNTDRNREKLVEVNAMLPEFAFGKMYDKESFIIKLQSMFLHEIIPEDEKTDYYAVSSIVGSVQSGTMKDFNDNGFAQSVTVKTGITNLETALVPNPVCLKPFRTFTEVDQPCSDFVFRMKDTDDAVYCALFEADGGAWKKEAMDNIKKYLEDELGDKEGIMVIS